MSTQYAREDEEVDLNEPVVVGDLSTQQVSDVLDPYRKVRFEIKKASIRRRYADPNDKTSPVEVTNLSIESVITADGVDGEGKYANKHMFTDLILAFNPDTHKGDWWEKRARGPARQFFEVLGYEANAIPPITRELLEELGGKEFIADILRKPVQEKVPDVDGEPVLTDRGKQAYRDTGDYKNELANYRKAE